MSISFGEGHLPGLLGWCVAEHGRHYAEAWGFGPFFECKVACEMASFLARLDQHPANRLFWATDDHGPVATVSLDAGDSEDGLAHLRWFITAERSRGQGVGTTLLASGLDAARHHCADGIFLTTFDGLLAARALYEKAGFRLVNEVEDTTWGKAVREQRFEMRF